MKVSAVLLYYNGEQHIDACLSSLASQGMQPDEILLVDNGSTTPFDAESTNVRVLRSDINLGVAGGLNLGISATTGDIVITITQDVVLQAACLSSLVQALDRRSTAAVVGCKLLLPASDVLQHAGASLSYPLAVPCHRGKYLADQHQFDVEDEVPYVTGALLGIRRSMIEVIGGFDQQFYPAYYEDPDLCFRARELGLSVVYVPTAIAWHAENSTIERMSYQHFMVHHANRLRFISKWLPYDAWVCDFLPAERAFLMTLNGAEERRALADAYVAISYEQMTEECRTMLGELAAVANVSCDVNSEESISTGLETHLWPPTDFLKARNLRL